MAKNIKNFTELPQFQTRGARDTHTDGALKTLYTSIVGPSFGYCHTPFGEGAIVSRRSEEETGIVVYTISFPWGGTLYCNDQVLRKYERTMAALPLRTVQTMFNIGNRRQLTKCRELRNEMSSGKTNPYLSSESIFDRKKYWCNFDDEIREAIYCFCHDPDFVRPDNYCKDTYCCTKGPPTFEKCKHQRHNWMISGSLELQYQLFLQSEHFSSLVRVLKRKFPDKQMTDEYIKKKVFKKKSSSSSAIVLKRKCELHAWTR